MTIKTHVPKRNSYLQIVNCLTNKFPFSATDKKLTISSLSVKLYVLT